ncbi:MAG TPA: hypothetical protein PKG95_07205 [Anaerolineaceae bacterium]|nr:hypothetical protein [Anaerolineaceae bacterium]
MKTKPLVLYLAYVLICAAGAIAVTLSAPSDLENQWLWGVSLNRWLLVFVMAVVGLLAGAAAIMAARGGRSARHLEKLFQFSPAITTLLFVLLLVGAALLLVTFTTLLPNRFFFARLRPLLALAVLVLLGGVGYAFFALRHRPWLGLGHLVQGGLKLVCRAADGLGHLLPAAATGYRFLIFPLVLALPLLFTVAFRYDHPTGYAGLYTLMSDELVAAGFRLPDSVPYYGPGGMPFAYPPVGFYLMGLVTTMLPISDFTYLRFAPPLFSLLALLPLALLTFQLTRSRSAAVIAALVVATSQRIFYIHGTSGGVVRALAFLFALWGVYFYLQSFQRHQRLPALLAGLFMALTALTHLGYAEFVFLFVAAHTLTHLRQKQTLATGLITGLAVLVLVAPWTVVMVGRHGWQIFSGAFQSHGNNYFLNFFHDPARLLPWFESSLHAIYKLQFVWGLILLGLIYALFNRLGVLPVWFGLMLVLMSEGDRYLITCGAVAIGLLASALAHALTGTPTRTPAELLSPLERSPAEQLSPLERSPAWSWRPVLFLLVVTGLFYQLGWRTIPAGNPSLIKTETMDLAAYVRSRTDQVAVFLVVAAAEEAEWFPYLLQRIPAAASWGGEWLGSYARQLELVSRLAECKKTDSPACLYDVLGELPNPPDVIITPADTPTINQNLAADPAWSKSYQNERYILWEGTD